MEAHILLKSSLRGIHDFHFPHPRTIPLVLEQNVEMLISKAVKEIQFGKQCVIDVTLHYDEVPAIVGSTRQQYVLLLFLRYL